MKVEWFPSMEGIIERFPNQHCQYSPESDPPIFGKSAPRVFGQTRHPVEWQASEMAGVEGCE